MSDTKSKTESGFDYDLFVIGAGSGGVRSSRMAAATGARVGIAESYRYGGTCVIRGCVPKKLFSYAAHWHETVENGPGFGWEAEVKSFSWPTLMGNKDQEIDRLEGIYGRILDGANVDRFPHHATVVNEHTVAFDGKQVTAEKILIATGETPSKPPVPGAELALTTNDVFELEQLPKRCLVYGGAFTAVEFGSIFNGLGAEVELVYRGDQVLRGFDSDLRKGLTEELAKKGLKMRLSTTIEKLEKNGDGSIEVSFNDGKSSTVDLVLFATGRTPQTRGIGLEEVGVNMRDNGEIIVDDHYQTNVPSIFALGDIISSYKFTPVALEQGMVFVDTWFKNKPRTLDLRFLASAVFSDPNVATCGLTEEQAREELGDDGVEIYRSQFGPMSLALPKLVLEGRDEKMLMKMVVDKSSRRVLGVHVIGPDAGEIVQGFSLALSLGATKEQVDATVGIHPTAAEELVTMREPVAA